MALADSIRQTINSGSRKLIAAAYLKYFGRTIKDGCGSCYNEAIFQLIEYSKMVKKEESSDNKYRLKLGIKQVVITTNGQKFLVTRENFSDAIAEQMLANPLRAHLVEVNEKKSLDTQPTSLTSIEVLTDGSELVQNVSEPELNTNESKPLTGKKKKKKKTSLT